MIPMKMVRVITAVPFNGPSTTTLLARDGVLEYHPDLGLVKANPHRRTTIGKPICIPVSNVSHMEELDVVAEAQAVEAAQPAAEAPKAEAITPVTIFVKDKATGQIREMASKVAASKQE